MTYGFELSSTLAIPPSRFWNNATLADVNSELAPWVRMTAPQPWRTRPLREWPAGQTLFSSWILLFGILPIDRHTFFFQAIDPERGFDERSSSLTNLTWQHSRHVLAHKDGCIVTDRLNFECRIPLLGAMLLPIYKFIFQGRHRVLRRRYADHGG